MLIEFRVANYKSFRDSNRLSMVASSDKTLPENAFEAGGFANRKLLRSAVIYGANASGKSNLFNAIAFAVGFVLGSSTRKPESRIPVDAFALSEDHRDKPSEFEFTFLEESVRYQYGFSLDHRTVVEEWLIAYPKGMPQNWFKRIIEPEPGSHVWSFGAHLRGDKRRITGLTRPDALFLSVAAQFGHKDLTPVFKWFSQIRFVLPELEPLLELYTVSEIKDSPNMHKRLQTLLGKADVGIDDFIVVEEKRPAGGNHSSNLLSELISGIRALTALPQSYRIITRHHVLTDGDSIEFSWYDESRGTRRLFAMGAPVFRALDEGVPLFVDELDASMHSMLVRYLVEAFNDPAINTKDAQLIFSTHDTSLLDPTLFRRDQIWFVEKDRFQASRLRPLLDFKPRKDEALQKGYLQGRYGGVPILEDWPKIRSANG